MSNEGDRAAVFRTTKVRTKLKGDASWLQRRSEPENETVEEKPWIAEVRAGRVDGAPIETSPVSSPTTSTPSPVKSDTERAPTGFLIRGVFTKLDKPAPSSTSNGYSGTTQFTKKPSENYKRIAPHTVRSTSENQEGTLSPEEKEKRTEIANNVLKKSAARQRSYVLSAAKKYDSKDKADDTSPVNSDSSFVAKRVEITDDDESVAPVSTPPSPPVVPVTSVASAPEPKPRKLVNTSVKTAANVNDDAAPKPVKEEPLPVSVTEKDPFEDMKPGCTKVATPLPELIPVYVQAVCADVEHDDSEVSGLPLVKLTPASPIPVSPTQASPASPTPAPPASTPISPAVKEDTVKTEPEPEPEPFPNPRSGVDTLTALSDTLISFDTSSTSSQDDEPGLAEEEGGSADSHTEDGVEQEPTLALSNCEPITGDLLALSDGPEESAEPVPPSPHCWSQDLLGELDSLSTQREEEKQTDETSSETQSPTEAVTTTTKTVIITDKSSADPFDPYPIGTTSPNSSSDLFQPLADISINRVSPTSVKNEDPSPKTNISCNALESLADDIIPINTDTTSQKAAPVGQAEDQQTLVKSEKKSSPWDRWTLPTDYTTTTTSDEEEEEEEEKEEEEEEEKEEKEEEEEEEEKEERETRSEPEPAMDRTVMEKDQHGQTPEPETKKGFVYVKEYVNATELSLHNAKNNIDSGSDDLTSSSVNDTYNSPSTYTSDLLSSTCTYCGELVGHDAKITIEHLNINCHPACFKCGVCSKPMGDLLYNMFLHGGKVHCESCYSKALD
ncbi:flocculation protein FLO11-like isoform X2 [Thunnus albacares]|uniref:flocculation protein FLO11-like isoform X2 n=1 Tax=Thunnus albacares TaxID=8236 RepID=UPI001CF70421|nr:flocculation protein FLO11-like isoform X2 [Thunnus albacares]